MSDSSTVTTADLGDVKSNLLLESEEELAPEIEPELDKAATIDEAIVNRRRTVSFDDKVRVREHSVVVGVHPMTTFPIGLSWESATERIADIDYEHHSRQGHYVWPRHLSFEERRDRLFEVNAAFDSKENRDEVDSMLQNAWEADYVSPSLHDMHTAAPSEHDVFVESPTLCENRIKAALRMRRSHSVTELTALSDKTANLSTLQKHSLHRIASFDDWTNLKKTDFRATTAELDDKVNGPVAGMEGAVKKPLARLLKKRFFKRAPRTQEAVC
ncbi:hypothetical protein MPSEU_000933100 [Mayamaea pseudoterrestris]|nr:hypothetical protein MPSEU_000933100 [Mayamaea pseudoterrestris]